MQNLGSELLLCCKIKKLLCCFPKVMLQKGSSLPTFRKCRHKNGFGDLQCGGEGTEQGLTAVADTGERDWLLP
jgi:hypothetical protein